MSSCLTASVYIVFRLAFFFVEESANKVHEFLVDTIL